MALIQERFKGDPWKVLVASILLIRTRGKQVRNIITDFFMKYPTPESLCNADTSQIESYLRPLGLYRRRTILLKKLAKRLVREGRIPLDRQTLMKLPGVGDYVADSFEIFVLNRKDIKPRDRELRLYLQRRR